ncbi:hypothetical protein [Duganella hordei]|uniref:hypothetical protein n=1 Tax=Duganella hordei TaxID=2865934 RepID=UPI00333E6B10
MMKASLKSLCAVLLIPTANYGYASDLVPHYVGIDYGIADKGGRIYGGYELGTVEVLGKDTLQGLELMGYSFGIYGEPYFLRSGDVRREYVRASGFAINWTVATKIAEKVTANSRLGVSFTHAKIWSVYGDAQKWDSVAGVAGAGVAYAVDRKWTVRSDINYMPIQVTGDKKQITNGITAGVDYKF